MPDFETRVQPVLGEKQAENLAAKELFGASSVNYFTLWIENTADLNVSSSKLRN
jgi:hypothetical protein